MNPLRATVIAAASAAAFVGAPVQAQDSKGPPSATPGAGATTQSPRPPGPAGDPRTDPDQIPDPHPSGKTSDEGATAGSSAATAPAPAHETSAPAAKPRYPSAYRGKKSPDPQDDANRRLPAARDKSPQ